MPAPVSATRINTACQTLATVLLCALLASPVMPARVTGSERPMPQLIVREPIRLPPLLEEPPQADADADSDAQATLFHTPLQGRYRLSSAFGMRKHPIRRQRHLHSGADMAAPRGTPVHAVADGVVSEVRSTPGGYGRLVVVDHADGYASWYAHLDRFQPGLRVGQRLQRGAQVGTVGSSGSATGPHLHLEIRLNEVPLEPMALLQHSPATTPPPLNPGAAGAMSPWRQHASPP